MVDKYREKIERMFFTQSSLAVYKSCKYRFKMKYLLGIQWDQEEQENVLNEGKKFHLEAERYFKGITNLENSQELEELKSNYPIKEKWEYLSEIDVRESRESMKLLGRFDLIIIKPQNKVTIVDFKTNSKPLIKDTLEGNSQTELYLYLAWENYNLITKNHKKIKELTMEYYQSKFSKETIKIKYTKEKHEEIKEKLLKKIKEIKQIDFEEIKKNKISYCSKCEFSRVCW